MWTKRCLAIVLLGLFYIATLTVAIPNYAGLPRGPYCAGRYPEGRCCRGRQDDCGAPILSTTCYCDDFCNRTNEEDCCPDYWSHCRGIVPPPAPIKRCTFEGKNYDRGNTFKNNCNICKCEVTFVGDEYEERYEAEVLCGQERCLIEENLLEELGSQQYSLGWQPSHETKQSKFWGRTLAEGVELRLGTLSPSKSVYRMNPVRRIYDPDSLPREFDSRTHWPHQISGIRDQGWCGASWAYSTVDVATDRFAVMSQGEEAVELSAQHLLSCNNRGQLGCKGGYLDRAWLYLRKFGLVDEECYPSTGKNDKCKLRKRNTLRTAHCGTPPNPLRTELYKVGPAYRLGNETDIMQEILTSGPVQATMRVYQDFFVYRTGVYKHSKFTEKYESGYHSVRIIGWGEEYTSNRIPEKYWLVANSWGTDWGENGLFKIAKGSNECEIETFVLAAWAKTM